MRPAVCTPFCLLSSALFNISGKPFPWSPVSWLTAGQGELPGRAVLQNKPDLSQKSWCFNVVPLHLLHDVVISPVCGDGNGHEPPATALGMLSLVGVGPPGPSLWSASMVICKRAWSSRRWLLQSDQSMKIKVKIQAELGLYVGLLPSRKSSAVTRRWLRTLSWA